MAQSYRQLIAWQKAMDFVCEIYAATAKFPREELYGLTSQLRRAAVSVPSNIAEGQARFSKVDFRHFLRQSRGSLAEVETQLTIAKRLGNISEADLERLSQLSAELGRLLNGLINSIGPK
jgi:four helix bundle protein